MEYTRLVFLLREEEYQRLVEVCKELDFKTLDDCITWALERLFKRCHTGSMSSAVSSDVSNHPPDS